MNDGARQIPPRNVAPRRLENGKLPGGNWVWGIISHLRWVPNGVSKVLEVPCTGVAGEPSRSPVCLSPNGAKFPPGCSLGEGPLSGTIVGGPPKIGDRICEDWVVCDQDGATEHGFPSAGIVSAGLLWEFGEVEMLSSDAATYTRFEELKPGDRIEVEQVVTVGSERRTVKPWERSSARSGPDMDSILLGPQMTRSSVMLSSWNCRTANSPPSAWMSSL